MEAGDKLGFRFRKVEGDAVGFRDRGDEKAEEAEDLRKDVPAENAAIRVKRRSARLVNSDPTRIVIVLDSSSLNNTSITSTSPSLILSATLPVNPSHTMTSARPL